MKMHLIKQPWLWVAEIGANLGVDSKRVTPFFLAGKGVGSAFFVPGAR